MAAVRADGVARPPTQWKIDGVVRTRHDRPALRPDGHDLHRRPGDAQGPLVHVEHDLFWGEAHHLVPRAPAHVTIHVAADAGPLRCFGHRCASGAGGSHAYTYVAGRRGVNRSDAEVPRHCVAQEGTDRDLSRRLSSPPQDSAPHCTTSPTTPDASRSKVPSMLARVRSAAVLGIDAYLVDVETDIANGLPTFATVGLPQGAVKEGRERVYAALANTGYTFPLKRITVNLAPADIRKDGSAFDLPIAVGILAATEQISSERLGRVAVLGELGLEGAIRPVRGALPVALAARTAGLEALVLPRENLPEAGVVSGVRVLGAGNLAELADFLDGRSELPEARVDLAGLLAERAKHDVDFGEVKGQAHAKRALEVAAAGGHNIFT